MHSCSYSVALKPPEPTQTPGGHVRGNEDGSFARTKLCNKEREREGEGAGGREGVSMEANAGRCAEVTAAAVPDNTQSLSGWLLSP